MKLGNINDRISKVGNQLDVDIRGKGILENNGCSSSHYKDNARKFADFKKEGEWISLRI
jgi:hypothetical protein